MHYSGMPAPAQPRNPVIFFDGVCGLCNLFVDFVMARDKSFRFRFSPLQGETAAAVLKAPPGQGPAAAQGVAAESLLDDVEGLKSVILWDEQGLHRKSKAALRVLAGLGGLWSLTRLFLLVPAFLRDPVYDFIAKNRYRWFGKKESCRMPTPSERARFLP